MGLNSERELVEYAVDGSKVLTVKAVSYLEVERGCIDRILEAYLVRIERAFLMNQVAYCLHELAANAHRANVKRVYFNERGLDIGDAGDYARGLRSFRDEVFERILEYHGKLKAAGLYIKIDFRLLADGTLRIRVRNNTPLSVEERDKILGKFELLKRGESLPDAYGMLEDYSEGAGLGLYMILNLLRGMGMGSDALLFDSNERETVVSLFLR